MAEARLDRAVVREGGFAQPYRGYALGLLLAIYVLNCLDRQVINILAEPIKRDLGLADWQVGVMSGVSFALFYSMLGAPIAREAEVRHRPRIIALALAVWCGFTALSGLARSYLQLCLCRFGVGIGEAGCTPPALSLIGDYFPKDRRATAMGVFAVGAPLGVLAGMGFGGLVADAWGWRAAFLMAGAPGLVFALLALTTLREPRRTGRAVAADLSMRPSIRGILRRLSGKSTFWLLALGVGFKLLFTDGQAPFLASFFLRSHHDQIVQIAAGLNMRPVGFLGLTLGLINGLAGVLSGWMGGAIADRAAARDPRRVVIAPMAAMLIATPAYVAALYVADVRLAFGLLVVQCLMNVFWAGPVYSTVQAIVPPTMRATATAVLLFIMNVMGTGVGPLLVGALSDGFAVGQGVAGGLRSALTVISVASLLGVGFYALAWRTIAHDLEPD